MENNGSPREAMVNILRGALRSEAGVRDHQRTGKPTGYYAGRKSGFVCSAATLAHLCYGVDYDAAKAVLGREVNGAGAGMLPSDLRDPHKSGELATEMVNLALSADV
jgi:hypothetical protein